MPLSTAIQIHGDNVIECERALGLIERSFMTKAVWLSESNITCPKFELQSSDGRYFEIQLLPGHGRWGVGLAEELVSRGALLREGADAVLTRFTGHGYELLLGLEFCGALPAGNNAWQRHGRALAFAQAQVPYLIFAEVGGQELGANREPKASRFPNPAVPFALLQTAVDYSVAILPVYEPAPSATVETRSKFAGAFGELTALKLIHAVLTDTDTKPAIHELQRKGLEMVGLLSESRRRNDSLHRSQWIRVMESEDRFHELASTAQLWDHRIGPKVASSHTAVDFVDALVSSGSRSLHSSALPMAWLPPTEKKIFVEKLERLYGAAFEEASAYLEGPGPLVVVLVTGFKPRGDDSRPDRGLMPLARMLAGRDAQLMTFIWGPAKPRMLEKMKNDLANAARENGLVEAARACSDLVVVDSINSPPFVLMTHETGPPDSSLNKLSEPRQATLSEHDVDSAVHFMLTQPHRPEVVEGLCNPPGGDWSGISLIDANGLEVRWTSLPRVSASEAKRPDHVIQFMGKYQYVLSVESKHVSRDLEVQVGPALTRYLDDLMIVDPNVARLDANSPWSDEFSFMPDFSWNTMYSVVTFEWRGVEDLKNGLTKADADVAAAWDISVSTDEVDLHLLAHPDRKFILDDIEKVSLDSFVRVKIHKH